MEPAYVYQVRSEPHPYYQVRINGAEIYGSIHVSDAIDRADHVNLNLHRLVQFAEEALAVIRNQENGALEVGYVCTEIAREYNLLPESE